MPGLGEITPIKLQLNRANFNALISRHSQPIRWLQSEKCPCIGDNQKVDENCPFCNGIGETYTEPTQSYRVETVTAPIDGIIELPGVIWVRDAAGNTLTFTDGDCVAYVPDATKGYSYIVKYTEDVSQTGSGIAQYVASALYSIDIPTQIDFGSVQGSLLSVSASIDGTPVIVESIFRNMFTLSRPYPEASQVDVEYTYLNPFEFVLIHNNYSKSDQKYLDEVSGDGLLIFPQRWDVNVGDLVIALNSTETKKLIYKSTGDVDNLPSFYLDRIMSAYLIRDEERIEFTPYTDFTPYKRNSIIWIGEKPEEGEQVSITYNYKTVYRVLGDVPDPRTSEDNRFPRKVAIKLYTDINRRNDI